MTDLEVHGVLYLYSTPWTSYSQLMVAAHKTESKNEEVWEKVRARAAMNIDTGEIPQRWSTRLPNWWPSWPGQGNSPVSISNSPRQRGHVRGWTDRGTPGHPSSHDGQAVLGQTALGNSTPTGCGTGTIISSNRDRTTKGLTIGEKASQKEGPQQSPVF